MALPNQEVMVSSQIGLHALALVYRRTRIVMENAAAAESWLVHPHMMVTHFSTNLVHNDLLEMAGLLRAKKSEYTPLIWWL